MGSDVTDSSSSSQWIQEGFRKGLQRERVLGYEVLWGFSAALLAYGIGLAFYRCMHCQ